MLFGWSQHRIAGVVAGGLAVAAVTALRISIGQFLGSDMALVFYILAVLVAAWIGGAWAGAATTLFSLVAGIALIIGPTSIQDSISEWTRVAVFTLEGTAMSGIIELLQRRTKTLGDTANELDAQRRLVERMALEDVMTNLGNRRAFERDLERSVARFHRNGIPLTLAIADVDGLKRTNDELGHARGDELLVAVAQAVSDSCRASDTAYRIGGDEFALLLPAASRKDYEAVRTRLENALSGVRDEFPGAGASIGAAHAPQDGAEPSALIRVADSRMYAAKVSGTGTHR
jgi:diguanylate cyclase (GGDEF)-like protein